MTPASPPEAPAQCCEGELLLLPNQVSQQGVLAEYALAQAPIAAFASPPVDVLSLWAGRVLENSLLLLGRRVPVSPSRFRLRRLWEAAIRACEPEWSTNDVAARAREAMETDHLCEHWLLPRGIKPGETWQDEGFCRWRELTVRAKAREGWLDPAEQLRWLTGLLKDQGALPVTLPARITLRGFPELTPLEQQLFAALGAVGVEVVVETPRPSTVNPTQLRAEDPESERWAAAEWAKRAMESGVARIGVLVNGLEGQRDELERVFLQVFHPEAALGAASPACAAFSVAGGRQLERFPVIREALDLLQLSRGGVKQAHAFALISRWLRASSWAGAEAEGAARAGLELRLRQLDRFEISLASLASQVPEGEAGELRSRINTLQEREWPKEPARRFHEVLAHWGWPGMEQGDPLLGRIIDAFRTVLEELEFLGLEEEEEALRVLRQLCREKRVSRVGGPLSPVQVLSLEDGLALNFDALRLVDLQADNWPPPAQTHGLLPTAYARLLPRHDPESQLTHCRTVQQWLLAGDRPVSITRPRQIDGVECLPSPLLTPLGEETSCDYRPERLGERAWPGLFDGAWPAPVALERAPAPPIEGDPVDLKAVVSVLNLQSACPYAAFLRHRLGARFDPVPRPFAGPGFTGLLVHRALERLYRGQPATGAPPAPDAIGTAVQEALELEHAALRLSEAELAAETRRLEALLGEWLATESLWKLGPAARLEEARDEALGGFRFRIRLDRIDGRTGPAGDEESVVYDYKTGRLHDIRWNEPRMTQLQLPLYAVLAAEQGEPVSGVGLLAVRHHDMQRRIVSEDRALARRFEVPGKGEKLQDWAETVAFWRERILAYLTAFRQGEVELVVHQEKALAWEGLDLCLRTWQEDEEVHDVG